MQVTFDGSLSSPSDGAAGIARYDWTVCEGGQYDTFVMQFSSMTDMFNATLPVGTYRYSLQVGCRTGLIPGGHRHHMRVCWRAGRNSGGAQRMPRGGHEDGFFPSAPQSCCWMHPA